MDIYTRNLLKISTSSKSVRKGFDLNGDGVIDPAELRFVLRSVRDVGSALSDERIETVLQQMDADQEGDKMAQNHRKMRDIYMENMMTYVDFT